MDGILLVQAYLLAQMRATDRVAQAYQQLGLVEDLRSRLHREASARGLGDPAHPMSLYSALLGDPLNRTEVAHSDRYAQRVDIYLLPLWPEFSFRVHGSTEGTVGRVGFGSWTAPTCLPDVAGLKPWAAVVDQLAPILATGQLLDEWFPQRDYSLPTTAQRGQRLMLQFDFDLLQGLIPLGP
jgi:hypothetical protein